MQGEIWRRSRYLIAHLLGTVADAGEVDLPLLVSSASGIRKASGEVRWSEKTVSNTIRDLSDFGVLRLLNRPRRARSARLTILGEAWLAGVLLPPLPLLSTLEEAVNELEVGDVDLGGDDLEEG